MHVEIRLDPKSSLKYAVFAEVPGVSDELGQPLFSRLGYLAKNSEIEHGEKIEELMGTQARADLGTLSVAQVSPGLSKDDVKTAFNQVWDYDEQVRSDIPESELESYAAALWSITHTRTDGTQASQDSDFRTASVAFGIFAPEIQSRLEQLQFLELTVGGVRLHEYQGRSFNQESLPISVEFASAPHDPNQNQRVIKVDGKVLGAFTGESPQLPVGTTATATLNTPLGAAAIATLDNGETIRIGTLKNYPYAQTDFTERTGTITIDKDWHRNGKFSHVARLDGQIIGEIKDQESKQLLSARNLLKEGTQLDVTLNRERSAVAFLTIDPDSVVYPDVQVHDHALSTPERATQLLPTLWSQSEGGITLAVDNRHTDNLIQFFDRYAVPLTFVQDAPLEQGLGYAVVKFENMGETVYSKLQAKFGEPLSPENYLAALQRENNSLVTQANQTLVISGKPVAMNYELKLHGQPNPLPVNTTIEAMRGYGCIHTTRNFEPHKAYGFKEGELALAYSGNQENPTQQVLFRVGQQYQITPEMISDPQYRQTWANVEKHNATELETFRDKLAWGLYYEPIGDYRDGKVYDFGTGREVTVLQPQNNSVVPKVKPTDLTQLIPISAKKSVEKNRVKDRAMASIASQFIGFSAQSDPDVISSTKDYQRAWSQYGLANTGIYTQDDVIMVSGSGEWRGVTAQQIQETFKAQYQPLLDRAIAAQSQFVVGDALGTDRLVQDYLQEKGYELSQNGQGFLQYRQKAHTQVISYQQLQVEKNDLITVSDEPTPSFKPTQQQQEALEKLQAWEKQPVSNDPSENIFLLKGYAGTGKSYITSQWLSNLAGRSLVYTAPTHKALGVGRAMLEAACDRQPDVRTLQSLLKVKLQFNQQSNQGEFTAKSLNIKEIQKMPHLILVDEASMLDQGYWDTLKQLAEHGKKILLIGDDAQIRPVKGNGKSPVFSDLIVKHIAELTQVVRYTTQQGYLATALRTDQGGEKMPIVSSPDNSVQALSKSEWREVIVSKFTSAEFQNNPHYFQIYAYTNERVDQLNRAVREKLWGKDAPEYVVGEVIVAKEPILDPLTGKKAMDNEQEAKIVHLYPPKVDDNGISCWLADVKLSTLDADNTNQIVTVKLVAKSDQQKLDQLLLSKEREYKSHPEPLMRSRLWKKFEEFKQEYGKAKYAYAATFHGAQGSTKEYVAIDEQNLNEHFDSRIRKCTNLTEQTELLTQRNELLYVAVTRSRQGTFVFNQGAELAQQYNRHSDTVWYLPDELKPIPSTPALHGEKNAPTPNINPQSEGILSVEQGIILNDVIPDAQIVDINWQRTENPTPLDARQVQVQRSQMVIPIIMDYLKVKGKSFVQGETFTAFWDASNGILHLLSNADNEPKLTAKYLGKDQGDKPLWEISPLVHEQEGKLTPRLSEGDVELLKTHQPKIEKLLLAQQKQQTQRRI